MNKLAICEMTRQEKLQAMDALCYSLAHDAGELASPAWHGEVLVARRAAIETGQARFVPLGELKREPNG